ncbi:hypothetical protein [Roseateles asaccharophilus]|uniref:Uncharacterized protein n=1 Tax=Roseateles asaccharophilus TaxID=582607 RepID=A0ABU2ABN7_9BURK|nr:hypothetical protein [Roseateles asaccharophilus]MDR7334584.1 hypothetical protein [Roseateles asaccharophilus]
MDAWLPLLQLEVRHGYYATGRCRGLRFEPTLGTAAAIRRADIAARSDGCNLFLHGPADAPDALNTPDEGLTWLIFTADADFACATDDPACRPEQLLWIQGAESGGDGTLTATPRPLRDARVASLLTSADRLRPPFAMLWLPLAELRRSWANAAVARLSWRLEPRATVWKYCLHGDWPEPALAIVDLSGEASFGTPARDRMDDGTPMLAIRSTGRIPLEQRPTRRLQLRSRPESDGHADKVLIRRLPMPAAQFLAREVIEGQPTVISEIHVHR